MAHPQSSKPPSTATAKPPAVRCCLACCAFSMGIDSLLLWHCCSGTQVWRPLCRYLHQPTFEDPASSTTKLTVSLPIHRHTQADMLIWGFRGKQQPTGAVSSTTLLTRGLERWINRGVLRGWCIDLGFGGSTERAGPGFRRPQGLEHCRTRGPACRGPPTCVTAIGGPGQSPLDHPAR